MVWRPKHAPKTAKQPGHATNCADCYSETTLLKYADPQRQRKAKSLRESKKQTTGASSATIKH